MTQAPPTMVPSSLKPHRGTAVLVLGILGLAFCFILGIIAWVMGRNDLKEMDQGIMDSTGRGLTQAGKICGMISVIIQIVVIVIWLVVVGITGLVAVTTH